MDFFNNEILWAAGNYTCILYMMKLPCARLWNFFGEEHSPRDLIGSLHSESDSLRLKMCCSIRACVFFLASLHIVRTHVLQYIVLILCCKKPLGHSRIYIFSLSPYSTLLSHNLSGFFLLHFPHLVKVSLTFQEITYHIHSDDEW